MPLKQCPTIVGGGPWRITGLSRGLEGRGVGRALTLKDADYKRKIRGIEKRRA